jgi:AraC-like DNA-binding protein
MGDGFKHERRIDLFADRLGIPGLLHFGRYRHRVAEETLSPHVHRDAMEICYLARGRQSYRASGREYRLRGGDCYWVGPSEPHDSAGKPQEKGLLYWVVLDFRPGAGEFLFLRGARARTLREALLAMPSRHFRLGPGGQGLLEAFLDAVTDRADPLGKIRCAQRMLEFLLDVVEASKRGPGGEVSESVCRALAWIEQGLAGDLSVGALADRAGLSVSRFKARFRREMGLPPGEYVLRRKVQAARERLLRTDASVTQIAYDLGFSSSQYFATVFRRYMRRSPSSLRSVGADPTDSEGSAPGLVL